MFFWLSKLLSFLLTPTAWVAVLLALALWRRSLRLGAWGLGLLLLFANEYIINQVLRAWEVPPVPVASLPRAYPCAVVLGGFTQPAGNRPADRTYLNAAADRMMHSILLYHRGKAARLLVTGGNSSIIHQRESEAGSAGRLALLCGVPQAAFLPEPRARNTRENALFSKRILDSLGLGDTVLLVTSGFHARRAAGCFARVGVPFRLFTTDARAQPPRHTPDVLLIPTPAALSKWDMLIHEWVGYAAYWAAGYV